MSDDEKKIVKRKRSKKPPWLKQSKYKKEYCQMIVDHMAQGYSFESFCAVAGVWKEALYAWVKRYPEFARAKELANIKCKLYYEQLGHAGMLGKIPGFNAYIWRLQMVNRFGWGDQKKLEADDLRPTIIEKLDGTQEVLGYEKVNDIETTAKEI